MKCFIVLSLSAFLLTNCSKKAAPPEKPASTISVKKNDVAWKSEGIYTSYNVDDDVIHAVSGKENEFFDISFKKGSIPVDGIMKDFSADVIIAPYKGSAVISDSYSLDTTKPNKLKIIVIDNPEKRIAGDFVLYLKRNKQFTSLDEVNVYQGRFDVRYEPFSMK